MAIPAASLAPASPAAFPAPPEEALRSGVGPWLEPCREPCREPYPEPVALCFSGVIAMRATVERGRKPKSKWGGYVRIPKSRFWDREANFCRIATRGAFETAAMVLAKQERCRPRLSSGLSVVLRFLGLLHCQSAFNHSFFNPELFPREKKSSLIGSAIVYPVVFMHRYLPWWRPSRRWSSSGRALWCYRSWSTRRRWSPACRKHSTVMVLALCGWENDAQVPTKLPSLPNEPNSISRR